MPVDVSLENGAFVVPALCFLSPCCRGRKTLLARNRLSRRPASVPLPINGGSLALALALELVVGPGSTNVTKLVVDTTASELVVDLDEEALGASVEAAKVDTKSLLDGAAEPVVSETIDVV